MEKAAAYIRVSTEDQVEFSPDAQLRAIRKYCDDKNIALFDRHIYKDEGISGRRAEARPGFMKMIGDAKKTPTPFDLILVHKFDRFARNREDSVIFKSMLRKQCGVRVISITERIEDDKFSIILESMLEAMAEYYSLNLGEEVKKGMTEKAIRGELQTPAPFGYEMSEGALVPKSGEAEMIALIFNLFLYEQMTGKEIAEIINSKGFLTKKGNKFQKRSIDYIIRNPIYCGKIRWNPKSKSDYSRDVSETSIVTVGKHEAIVDEATWMAANEKAHDITARKRKALESASFLNDKLKCGDCGGRMYLCGKKKSVFRCGNYLNGKCDFSQGISASKIEKIVENELLNDFGMFKIMVKNVEMRVSEILTAQEHAEVKASLINHLLFFARFYKDTDLLELFYFQGEEK